MDPHTGAILALAHYPFFDSNDYGAAYVKEEVKPEEIVTELEHEYVIRNGNRYPVFHEGDKKVIYNNKVGEGVFGLKAVTDPYEPGSVFKPIVMAAALDAGEVTPTTRSILRWSGFRSGRSWRAGKDIVIKNAEKYFGRETMTEVIEHSSNIGMTFVAQQLGRPPFMII